MSRPRRKQVGKELARPGDPLVGSTGVLYYEDDVDTKKRQSQTKISAKGFAPTKQRMIKDLPGPPHLITAIGAVFMYTVMGIGDREIQDILKMTREDYMTLKSHVAYQECFETVANEFINANSNLLAARIAAFSHQAVTRVADTMINGKKEENVLRASIDILDRAGTKPKDNAARQGDDDNTLRIVFINDDKQVGIELNGKRVS